MAMVTVPTALLPYYEVLGSERVEALNAHIDAMIRDGQSDVSIVADLTERGHHPDLATWLAIVVRTYGRDVQIRTPSAQAITGPYAPDRIVAVGFATWFFFHTVLANLHQATSNQGAERPPALSSIGLLVIWGAVKMWKSDSSGFGICGVVGSLVSAALYFTGGPLTLAFVALLAPHALTVGYSVWRLLGFPRKNLLEVKSRNRFVLVAILVPVLLAVCGLIVMSATRI